MLPQVVLQADVVIETLPAPLAHERPLARVQTHVRLEVSGLREGTFADAARVRFLSRVYPDVSVVAGEIAESPVALVADVFLFASVAPEVLVASDEVLELLRAVGADVRQRLFAVSRLVLQLGLFRVERRHAVLTEMRVVSVKSTVVHLLAGFCKKALATQVTRERLDLVLAHVFSWLFVRVRRHPDGFIAILADSVFGRDFFRAVFLHGVLVKTRYVAEMNGEVFESAVFVPGAALRATVDPFVPSNRTDHLGDVRTVRTPNNGFNGVLKRFQHHELSRVIHVGRFLA